jgi:uncharacterized protein
MTTVENPVAPANPIAAAERLPALDFVRGVCVLLMLPATVPWFCRPFNLWDVHPQPAWPPDRIVLAATLFFLDHKVLTLFALVFGMGFGLQIRRTGDTVKPILGDYLWRMMLLFVLGMAHVLLLWWADVLTIYAAVGVHLAFITLIGKGVERLSIYVCFVWFYLLVLVVTLFSVGPLAKIASDELSLPPIKMDSEGRPVSMLRGKDSWDKTLQEYIHLNNQWRIYRNGSLADVIEHRVWLHGKELLMTIILYGWYMLGCALLGVRLVRWGLLDYKDVRLRLSRRFAVIGIGLGVPLHLLAVGVYLIGARDHLAWCLSQFGALPLALLYLAILLAIANAGWLSGLQRCLRAVGQLALTNYWLQSLICVVLFHGYGFRLFGLPLTAALLVAGGIALFQLLVSPLWLRVFAMGPVEWLWRSLADRRARPLLIRKSI